MFGKTIAMYIHHFFVSSSCDIITREVIFDVFLENESSAHHLVFSFAYKQKVHPTHVR